MKGAPPESGQSIPTASHLIAFVVLTFLLSWPIWYASGVLLMITEYSLDSRWLIAQVGVLAPSLSALLLSALIGRRLRWNALRILLIQLLPLAVPGLLISSNGPSGVEALDSISAGLTLLIALVVVFFFSSFNRSLLLPATGTRPGLADTATLCLSLFLFPALFLGAWVLVNSLGGSFTISSGSDGPVAFLRLLVTAFAFNLMLGGSLGEEVGWRGFFLPALLARYGPLMSSLVLGIVWALWHLPVDWAGGFGFGGPAAVIFRIVWTIPLTIIFTWFYLRSRGSLLVALFLHTSINVLGALGFSMIAQATGVLTLLNLLVAGWIVYRWSARNHQ